MTELDPIARFRASYDRARQSEGDDPAARAAFATVDALGAPSVRYVLVKEFDARGFVVYTNLDSPKARDVAQNPRAALGFHWWGTGEQVRVVGRIESVAGVEADAYFAARPRGSQLGAWASQQSQPIVDRSALEASVAAVARRFADQPIARPPFWGGLRLVPAQIEFWRNCDDRLHDRELYTRAQSGWARVRLSP